MTPHLMLAAVDIREYPGAIPGAFVALVLAIAVARLRDADRRLDRRVAASLLFAVGLVLAVTVTPGGEAIAGATASRATACDVSRLAPLAPAALSRLTDESLNVYLFIPLGFALAFLPTRRWSLLFVSAAILLPIIIETVQAIVPTLGRTCQSGDIVDNWTGLALGLAIGGTARLLWAAVARNANADRG